MSTRWLHKASRSRVAFLTQLVNFVCPSCCPRVWFGSHRVAFRSHREAFGWKLFCNHLREQLRAKLKKSYSCVHRESKSGQCDASITNYTWSLKVIGQKYHVHNVLYTLCRSWPLTPWPKINRVPPLVIHNLLVKFESDWAKTVICILPTRSYTQGAKVDLGHHLQITCEVNRFSPLIMNNSHVKFGSDQAKTLACINSARFHKQSPNADLRPDDPKSIGFLLSSSTTYLWSLKVIGPKL